MQKQLILLYDYFRLLVINSFRKLLFKNLPPNYTPSKILIVRKGTIGDHVVCQPFYLAFNAIFKDAQIDLLTSNGKNEYGHIGKLPEHVLFANTYNFEDYQISELHAKIREQHYNMVIEFPQDLDTVYTQIRNMLFYRSCKIKYGLGWSIGNSYFLKAYRYFHFLQPRQFDKHKSTLIKQGFTYPIAEKYLVEDMKNIDTFDLPSQYIVIAPGAKFSSKAWSISNYKNLAKRLIQKDYKVVIVGNANEGEAWKEFSQVLNLAGKTSITEMKIILKNAMLFIGNDSGPMHLAYSVNTPLVVLFGSRNYPKTWWPPERDNVVVIHHAMANNPVAFINLEHTKKAVKNCGNLESITVEEVLNEALKQLAQNKIGV